MHRIGPEKYRLKPVKKPYICRNKDNFFWIGMFPIYNL